jgi:hypothetical protein
MGVDGESAVEVYKCSQRWLRLSGYRVVYQLHIQCSVLEEAQATFIFQ